MPEIRVLPLQLVNKIAAGECIERPSSVAKELIENSLDAGAKKIDVYIEQGGAKLVRVVDNGRGIDPQELTLAVKPHATSKLGDENDLYAISTLGFRGEALASIAAVSVMKISSVPAGADSGGTIEVSEGQCSAVRPHAGAEGTIVEVHNLFYNTPARRKFLKTAATEFGHIQEQVTRTALANPQIAFNLHHNGRVVMELPACENLRARIGDIFGAELAEPLLQVFVQDKIFALQAYISRPEHCKPSTRWQYFLVNGRPVRDRYLAHAVREAYRGLAGPDRHPIVFLRLDTDPTLVDVNVHPTKGEVRFSDPGEVHSLVLGAIRDRFLSPDLSAEVMPATERSDPALPTSRGPPRTSRPPAGDTIEERKQAVAHALADFLRSAPSSQPSFKFDSHRPTGGSSTMSNRPAKTIEETPTKPPETPEKTGRDHDQSPPAYPPPALQIHNTYLVAQTAEGLTIIDQHALHERVLYQKLKDSIQSGSLSRQRLLMPQVVNLTGRQMAQIEAIKAKLDELGVEIEPFGPMAVAVHSLPVLAERVEAGEFIEELLARLEDQIQPEPDQVVEHILQSLACKAAVKAGDPLSPDEVRALLEYRQQIDFTLTCPHGRPTALEMTLDELGKKFKRT